MTISKADRFNLEVLRAMALLYGSHPQQLDLDFHEMSGIAEDETWHADDEAFTTRTMRWLIESDLISGNLDAIYCKVGRAHLTSLARDILQTKCVGIAAQTLGSAVVGAVTNSGGDQRQVAEALMRRIISA